jgi:hypothetical protein
MSLSTRPPTSTRQRSANVLAVFSGIVFATITASASGAGCEGNRVFGPAYADVPFNVILAAITDQNPVASYSATIDWGDGTATTGSVRGIPCPVCGPRDTPHPLTLYTHVVSGTHTYSNSMSGVRISARVSRGGQELISCTTNRFDVLDGLFGNPTFLLPQIIEAGTPVTGLIATFSDSDPSLTLSDFAAVIDWGDGTPQSAGVVGIGSQAGTLSVSAPPGGHAYSGAAGHAFTVGITVTLDELIAPGHHTLAAGSVTVLMPGSPPPTPGGDVLSNPQLLRTQATLGKAFFGLIATFDDSNPSPAVSDFTATIDWGDGTQSAGVVGKAGQTLRVSTPAGGHTYNHRGFYTASVSLTEVSPGTANSTASGTISVLR